MRLLTTTIGAIAVIASFAVPAAAQDQPYLEAGKRTAEANCAQCHNIEPGGAFKLYPPSFTAIAKYYDPTMIEMKIMYPGHAVLMPQFHTFMFRENINNLVGYIVSLDE